MGHARELKETMQKYKSNITSTSGAAIRGVPVLVIAEDGDNATLFLDRAGTVPAPNPLTTGPDGVFYFYAVNGRYSLRTTVDGVTITDDDVVLMMDPEEITVAGPIAEAVAAAQAAATAAEFAVEASGIPELVAAAQNAVVDANNAVSQASTAASNAATAKSGADSARDAAVIAKNAAEAVLDSFDDRYLGAKAVAPTADNDGNALITGALYWDTVIQAMRAWNGSNWVTLPAATATTVGNTPAGGITANTVQAAINELDLEKMRADTLAASGGAGLVGNTPAGSITSTTVQAAINELDTEKVAKTDVIAIAKGGTGATSANAAADAIGAFRRGTLLGTVSQSGGVPTGAVIERGSNANGEYVRFADGTQICTRTTVVFSTVGTYIAIASPFAASFSAAPICSATIAGYSAAPDQWTVLANEGRTTTGCNITVTSSATQASFPVCVTAIGSWF